MTEPLLGDSGRRLQINPEPLRVTGPRVKEDYNAGRCEAYCKNGSGRCTRDATRRVGLRWFCWQHVRPSSRGWAD